MIKNRLGLENVPCWFVSRCDGRVKQHVVCRSGPTKRRTGLL